MTPRFNLHTHTNYVDGKNTAEEMIRAAIAKGFTSLGFSEHAYTSFDPVYSLSRENVGKYYAEIRALAQKYKGTIDIYLGLEMDGMDPQPTDGLDYFIASMHWVHVNDRYYAVDARPDVLRACIDEGFGGDVSQLLRAFYTSVANMAVSLKPDILGHFDLICKLNEGNRFFDETAPFYQSLAIEALDTAIDTGAIIEVNTGGMARGYRKFPYPAPFLLRHLLERKAPITLTSDAHTVETIDFAFDRVAAMLREMGFKQLMALGGTGFVPVPL